MSSESVNSFTMNKLERAGVHAILLLLDLILHLSAGS